MKIREVRAFYPRYRHLAPSWRTHFWQIAVRVQGDAGVVGWGCGGGGRAAVEVVERHFRDLLLGEQLKGAADIARLWEKLYRASLPYGRSGVAVMALSGVDLALWDLLGRAEKQSVCQLLGGPRRKRVRAYATGQDAVWYRDLGFTAHKASQMRRACAAEDCERVQRWAENARQVLGPQALLMVDAYMSWEADFALDLARRLAPQGIYWFEDVLLPDDVDGLAALRPQIHPVRLAGGEHDFTRRDFLRLAEKRALDIWQPDVTWCGGLTELLRIAALAEEWGVPLVPHRGGEIWGLQALAAGYGEDLGERVMGAREGMSDRLWRGEPEPVRGYLEIPEGAGFGVEVDEGLL